ncbi:MAG: acetate/propionate family kinase [Alphaproteobacteria bacterium]
MLLVLNIGSSSIKFALFHAKEAIVASVGYWSFANNQLVVDGIKYPFSDTAGTDKLLVLLEYLQRLNPSYLAPEAIIHRVVHGGNIYTGITEINDAVLQDLEQFSSFAPLHQPIALAAIHVLRQKFPTIRQYACFDTAFHHHQPRLNRLFALPLAMEEQGIVRYGFHGLSYGYITGQLQQLVTNYAQQRWIIAHLGSGASVCGLKNGKSFASSMGFSALDGLMMGTRCGRLDAGVLLHLLRAGWDVKQLEQLLYKESGLQGISGISGDMQILQQSSVPNAALAVELFIERLVEEIGLMVAKLNGVDGLIFTGGIGEHSASIRAQTVARLGWLGATLDEEANKERRMRIDSASSLVSLWCMATNEEQQMAEEYKKWISQLSI